MRGEDAGLLAAIVRFSLRFRGVVIALACVVIGYSLYQITQARYDVFPEFAPPRAVIQTESPGLSPEQVEVLVTQPIENAINGVAGIESLFSSSIQGLSAITVIFRPGSDIYQDRQVVTERLASVVGQMPQGVKPPGLTPLTSSTGLVLVVGLTSDRISGMDLRTLADWTIKPRLLAVPGVAGVEVYGGEVKQLQIQVKPVRLIQHSLALQDVTAAARRSTGIRGAGFIENPNQRIVLRSEGQAMTRGELSRTVILYRDGSPLTLGDVAKVAVAPAPAIGEAQIMGHPGVILNITAQFGINTLEVTRRVEQAFRDLGSDLNARGIILYSDLFRPANFIHIAIVNLRSSLLIGAILVILILFLFLFNFRSAAISCTAIPLSLLAAVATLESLGFSLNTMILGGLAIAIGEVVDDAVIDVENIFRRLRENRQQKDPRPVFQVVLEASIEVRSAVVYATFAVILVFIPLLTLSGLAGRIFSPLGIAYILSVLASLMVALTVTPALCLLLLSRRELLEKEPPVVRWLKERYRRLLLQVEQHPRTVISGVVALIVGGLALVPFLGAGFLPELREGHFIVHISAVPGTSLAESLRVGGQVTRELMKIPYVRSVCQRVGRAEKGEDVYGAHSSEFEVGLKPLKGEEFDMALAGIRKALSEFPGVNFGVKTFLTERIEETLSGYRASLVVNIFGNDLDVLDQKAQEVSRILGKVSGATEVLMQSPPGTPHLAVRLRQDDLIRWGFTPVEVLDAIHTAYQGEVAGQVYEGNRIIDVAVVLDPQERANVVEVGTLPVRNSSGTYLRLRQLADIYETSGRYVILHRGARRVQSITCNVVGRDLNSFVSDAQRQILSTVSFPPGTYAEFSGPAEAQGRSRRDLLVHSVIAGMGIVLLLSMVIGRVRNLLLIFLNLPFALVGGIFAVFASTGWLSLGSLVGFVTLFGITLRNSIMMISHFEHLVTGEGISWGLETAIRGASERLAPILMTALATALGLLPLAVGSGAPGREIEGPMAMVILGGLVTSTVLNLLVMPTLALRYGRFEKKRET